MLRDTLLSLLFLGGSDTNSLSEVTDVDTMASLIAEELQRWYQENITHRYRKESNGSSTENR